MRDFWKTMPVSGKLIRELLLLFLQLEKNMNLDDIIELMNHFEKVNIRHEGQTLIVE